MIFIHLTFYLVFILIKSLHTNLCVPDINFVFESVVYGTKSLDAQKLFSFD
jgi:hypothetical protein